MTLLANTLEEALDRGNIACECAHPACPGWKWPKGPAELAQRSAAFRARERRKRRAAKAKT